MQTPKFGEIMILDVPVDFVGAFGAGERWTSIIENEQSDSSCEHVRLQSIVLAYFHLG